MEKYCLWCKKELDWFSIGLIHLTTKEEYVFCSQECANNWQKNQMTKIYLVYQWDRCDRMCEHLVFFETEKQAEQYVKELEERYARCYVIEEIERG